MKRLRVAALFITVLLIPVTSLAKTFHYTIMTDDDLTVNAMSASDIERFLTEQGSGYAGLRVTDTDGRKRLVSRIIYSAAKQHTINSEALLALLQKESSGLTSGSTNEFAMGFGVCDSCSEAQIARYKGIAKQFRMAAEQLRYDFDILQRGGTTISGWKKGVSKTTIDGQTVIPQTHATALMLSYNPFIGAYDGGDPSFGGVSLLRKIWDNYFADRGRVRYPNGTIFTIRGEKGYYLIQNNTIRKFASKNIMRTMISNASSEQIITIDPAVANDQYRFYERGSRISLPNYTIVQNKKTGTVYLIVDGKKRGFTKEGLKAYGYYPEQIIPVSPKELRMPEGDPITGFIEFPGGAVVRVEGTKRYFYIDSDNKYKHPIVHKRLLDIRFNNEFILTLPKKRLKKYPTGNKALLASGTLATSKKTKTVYLIENRMRRPITSPEVLKKYGYTTKQIKRVPHKLLLAHKQGSPVTLKKENTKTE